MEFGIVTIIHMVLILFLIIELGLTAAVVTRDGGYYWGAGATANFMLFNCIWSILIALYLIVTPRVFARLYHALVALALLGLTALFWFAGSIALAVRTPTQCYFLSICQTAQAATAFGFFIWAIFTGLVVLEALARRGGGLADKSSRV